MTHPFTFVFKDVSFSIVDGQLFAEDQPIHPDDLLRFAAGLIQLPPPPNLVDIAAEAEDFTILVKALEATGLDDAVRAAEDVTVFAPTNAAFVDLANDLGFDGSASDDQAVFDFLVAALGTLGDPVALLSDVLLYHVSPGGRSAEEISDGGGTIATLLEGAVFDVSGTELVDLDPDAGNPFLAGTTIEGANGTILPIDKVLRPLDLPAPEPNIVEIAAGSEDFTLLVKALETAGLVETVQDAEDITVFAPTNAAFLQLARDLGYTGADESDDAVFDALVEALGTLGDPVALLTDVLLYHVSPGAKTAAEIDAASTVATLLDGATFASKGAELVDNEPDVANPEIAAPDLAAANGTVQVIDRVLLPLDIPGNEVNQVLNGNGAKNHLVGGNGDDLIRGFSNRDKLVGNGGDDNLFGGNGRDDLRGGDGDDNLFGNQAADLIAGGHGDDLILGGFGGDNLWGNAGDDEIFGGNGRDRLKGDAGDDHKVGGAHRDVFDFRVLSGDDTVKDFTRIDTLELSAAEFADIDAVLAATSFEAIGTVITGDRGTITLLGVDEESFHIDNILFV
ncbi:MAG: fasciclin domain-containing protein [Pseudomonadota bacterium]